MKKTIVMLCALFFSFEAFAWHIAGKVYCDANLNGIFDGDDSLLSGVTIEMTKDGVTLTDVTDANGYFFVDIQAAVGTSGSPGDWTVSIVDGLNPDATVLDPAGGTRTYALTAVGAPNELLFVDDANFAIDDPACREAEQVCWMTGGGVKFEPILGGNVAEHGPKDSLGGNVYPSCSQFPGNGGQWNHIAHKAKLHFQGTDIVVTRCGNVDGIPTGSESPVTPYNFIEFEGTGWVQGIHGNKISRTPVTFQARVEDRNEPGNESSTEGEDVDRYYVEVTDGGGGTMLQVGTLADPITITGGNLQLHTTSCD